MTTEEEEAAAAPIDIRSRSKDENPFLNFDTGGKIIIKVSETSKKYLRSLRKMCIEYSPYGKPVKRDNSWRIERRPDYLEQFDDVRQVVIATFQSLIDDGCLPFVATKLIHRSLDHQGISFLSMFAINRILGINEMTNTEKNSQKFMKSDEYKFQDLSKNLSSLQRVANSLEKRIDNQTFLAGFYRHSTKDVNIAVYSDDLSSAENDNIPATQILEHVRNRITGEIEKEMIESLFEKYNYVSPDTFVMELDSLSMIHFIKRLMLLHAEDPLKKRKIYYSPDRKKILKII